MSSQTETQSQRPSPPETAESAPKAPSCCSPAEQATCCEPAAKSTCCGPTSAPTPRGCGC